MDQHGLAWELMCLLDVEDDSKVKRLLDQFGLTEADTPVVAWGLTRLLAQSFR